MTLQSEKPRPSYNNTQLELYAICLLMWNSFLEKVADFTAVKAYYTTSYGNERLQQIEDAENLPGDDQRKEAPKTTHIEMDQKGDECLAKWQFLRSYIEDAYKEEFHEAKLDAAGWTLYRQASGGNWEVLAGLMTAGKNFIADNAAELAQTTGGDPNMPASFQGEFNTLKDEFDALYEQFGDALEDAEEQTTEKINANNDLHAITMKMAEDGQKIYRNDRATQERFIYEKVLSIVRGSRGVDKTLAVDPASRLVVERVVLNSAIVNSGSVTLWIAEGDVETQPPGALQLDPGEETVRPENDSTITIFNNDPAAAGEVQVRVTID